MDEIETINRDELKALLDEGADIRLVMTLHEWAFNAMHIPGSIQVQPDTAVEVLNLNDDIIVYCSDVDCVASQFAYRALVENGFRNVRRYAGGLSDCQAAGYPLEGTAVDTRGD
jgi:rhodanese-related sulfurtransferase